MGKDGRLGNVVVTNLMKSGHRVKESASCSAQVHDRGSSPGLVSTFSRIRTSCDELSNAQTTSRVVVSFSPKVSGNAKVTIRPPSPVKVAASES